MQSAKNADRLCPKSQAVCDTRPLELGRARLGDVFDPLGQWEKKRLGTTEKQWFRSAVEIVLHGIPSHCVMLLSN